MERGSERERWVKETGRVEGGRGEKGMDGGGGGGRGRGMERGRERWVKERGKD